METVALVQASDSSPQDPPPDAEDVTAGTWGLVVFLLLIGATVVLMRSFLKQMRKTEQARKEGVFGTPADGDGEETPRSPG